MTGESVLTLQPFWCPNFPEATLWPCDVPLPSRRSSPCPGPRALKAAMEPVGLGVAVNVPELTSSYPGIPPPNTWRLWCYSRLFSLEPKTLVIHAARFFKLHALYLEPTGEMTSVIPSVCGGFQGTLKWLKIEQQKKEGGSGFLRSNMRWPSDHAVFLRVQSKWSWDWQCCVHRAGPSGGGRGGKHETGKTPMAPYVATDKAEQNKQECHSHALGGRVRFTSVEEELE